MGKKKKSNTFKVLVEALVFGGIKNFKLSTSRIDHRKLSIDEIKDFIKEEFGKAKDVAKERAKLAPKGWGDTEIENEINWVEKLNLKEFFFKADDKKNKE